MIILVSNGIFILPSKWSIKQQVNEDYYIYSIQNLILISQFELVAASSSEYSVDPHHPYILAKNSIIRSFITF